MKGILSTLLITLTALCGDNRAFSQGLAFTYEGGRPLRNLAIDEIEP